MRFAYFHDRNKSCESSRGTIDYPTITATNDYRAVVSSKWLRCARLTQFRFAICFLLCFDGCFDGCFYRGGY